MRCVRLFACLIALFYLTLYRNMLYCIVLYNDTFRSMVVVTVVVVVVVVEIDTNIMHLFRLIRLILALPPRQSIQWSGSRGTLETRTILPSLSQRYTIQSI
jgi:hypothetical protein